MGELKTADILSDVPFLLKEAGFLKTQAMYVGGLQYLLECESIDELAKMLKDGRDALQPGLCGSIHGIVKWRPQTQGECVGLASEVCPFTYEMKATFATLLRNGGISLRWKT